MNIIDKTILKIKNLEYQGATGIVYASLSALKIWLSQNPTISSELFKEKTNLLLAARPTEPFVQNVLGNVILTLSETEGEESQKIINKISATEEKLKKNEDLIIENGFDLLKDKKVFFTHCHSSTVNNIFIKIKNSGQEIKVYSTETRPLYQGRITAKKLAENGIEVISFIDSFALDVINDQEKYGLKAVILGADAILSDGSVLNKVGSFGIAQSARLAQIPVYIACTLLKYTINNSIHIEERSREEVWPEAPDKVAILNPAFDRVPAAFITSLITENGIIKPEELKEKIQQSKLG